MSEQPAAIAALESFGNDAENSRLLQSLPSPPPSVARVLGWLVVLIFVAGAAIAWRTPWLQTAAGAGTVVALNPADRVHNISAFVDGRVERWFVQDGAVVSAGDPIVEISDIDPDFVERLQAERSSLAHALSAARIAAETARLNYDRQEQLLEQGLTARKDFEAAKIAYQESRAREAGARAALNKADIGLSRQSTRTVKAPEDGRILEIVAGNTATVVSAGQTIATFAPIHVERAVEVFVSGLDAPLVSPGLEARIMFEGWPAVQFSGWPEAAIGTFAGIVTAVDPAARNDGRFRVLIAEDPNAPWPDDRYLRLGSRARAWVRLTVVPLGYELWRQLNRFPPRPPSQPAAMTTP